MEAKRRRLGNELRNNEEDSDEEDSDSQGEEDSDSQGDMSDCVEKSSQSYCGSMIASLIKLKCDVNFCDVTIKSGKFDVKAHKVILSSATDYFKAMFMNKTKEAKTGIVDFSNMRPEVVEQCIRFIYSGNVNISMQTARGLLDASEMLQLPELSKLCVEFLADRVDLKSCTDVIYLSNLYNKDSLSQSLAEFLKGNLGEFIESDGFRALDFNSVRYCMRFLVKHGENLEMQKWNGILTWTNDDLEGRKCHFPALFKLLDLRCMPNWFLTKVIWINEHVNDSLECFRILRDALIGDEKGGGPAAAISAGSQDVSSIISFDGEQVSWCNVACMNASVAKFPSKLNQDMDVIHHMGKLFVGTGLHLYEFSDGNWNKMDVDFNVVKRNPYSITCSKCHKDHWYLGEKESVYEVSGYDIYRRCKTAIWSTIYDEKRPLNMNMSTSQTCKHCSGGIEKKNFDDSCYNRCIGVGNSVYMFTRYYVIEYDVSTSKLIHHDVAIRLGNGFFLASTSVAIFALGGNGTGMRAVAFHLSKKQIFPIKSMKNHHSFCRCIFKDGNLHILAGNSNRIVELYNFREKDWSTVDNSVGNVNRQVRVQVGDNLQLRMAQSDEH